MGYEWEKWNVGGTVLTRLTSTEEQALGWPAQVPIYNSSNIGNFDWRKASTRQGVTQNHQLSLSAGTQIARLYTSFSYLNQIGVQKDQDYERYNIILNGDITPNKWLSVGISNNLSMSIQNFGIVPPKTGQSGSKDLYSRAGDQFPYALPEDENGVPIYNPGGNLTIWNPLIDIDRQGRSSTIPPWNSGRGAKELRAGGMAMKPLIHIFSVGSTDSPSRVHNDLIKR